LLFAAAVAGPVSKASDVMPLYEDLTGPRLPVTTSSEQARRYFNQGLLLTYGFNHAGAVRSFREAQRLDPKCALCGGARPSRWGPISMPRWKTRIAKARLPRLNKQTD
jgi:hypothetical protein